MPGEQALERSFALAEKLGSSGRDAVLAWLASRGIAVAPVTIDNDDFLYNQRLVDARVEGRTIDVRGEYLAHMMKMGAMPFDSKRMVYGGFKMVIDL